MRSSIQIGLRKADGKSDLSALVMRAVVADRLRAGTERRDADDDREDEIELALLQRGA